MLGKIAIGTVIGVTAVAAAPFTGGGSVLGAATLAKSLAGVGAIAGAVGAGVAGGTAGYACAKKDKEECDVARQEGKQEAKAEHAIETEKLKSQIKNMLSKIERREQFIVTAFAVGICAANCDGEISDLAMIELDELVAGIGGCNLLSEVTKKSVAEMKKYPPSLPDVQALIKEHGFTNSNYTSIFSDIISVTVNVDGEITEVEKSFIETWNKLAA